MNPLKYVFSTCILAIHNISVYMFSLGISEELEKVSCKHELHDDVDWVIIHTHGQDLHNVLMVEVTGVVGDRKSIYAIIMQHHV